MKSYFLTAIILFTGILSCKKGIENKQTLAIVSKPAILSCSNNFCTITGNITDNGGATITERGICYITGHNPTVQNFKVVDSSSNGLNQFTVIIKNLQANTSYAFRSYAINAIGTAYGDELTFTTPKDSILNIVHPPVVVTNPETTMDYTSFVLSGSIIANGGSDIMEEGFCYSVKDTLPGFKDSAIKIHDTIYNFTINSLTLPYLSKWYVRAYAIKGLDTSYGNTMIYKTVSFNAPTLVTTTPGLITMSGSSLGGKISSGVAVSEKGICFNTSTSPTTANLKLISKDTASDYSININGLYPNTTYYARAYATNPAGTAYGNEVSFTTQNFTLSGNYVKQIISSGSTTKISDTINFFYNTTGHLTSLNNINFVYGLSLYNYPSGINNYPNGFQYDLSNNIVSESLSASTSFSYGTNTRSGGCTEGVIPTYYTNNRLLYSNNNVIEMDYHQTVDRHTIKPGQNTFESDTMYYTYTNLTNPLFNLNAYAVYIAANLFSDWQSSANMPATENLSTFYQTTHTPYTSNYTYTTDSQGRVATQIQTKSTGEIITRTYSYY